MKRLLFALLIMIAVPAIAATVTLSNGSSCTASSVVVTCAGDPAPPAPPATPTTPTPPTPLPPAPPPTSCTPQNSVAVDLPFGEVRRVFAASGQVSSYRIPTDGAQHYIALTQGQGSQSPTTVTEMSISKCPGVIQPQANGCYFTSPFNNFGKITAYIRATPWISGQSDIGGDGCWAPTSEGTWYVNVKWTYPRGCPFGACGFSMQWGF